MSVFTQQWWKVQFNIHEQVLLNSSYQRTNSKVIPLSCNYVITWSLLFLCKTFQYFFFHCCKTMQYFFHLTSMKRVLWKVHIKEPIQKWFICLVITPSRGSIPSHWCYKHYSISFPFHLFIAVCVLVQPWLNLQKKSNLEPILH